jgi:hypothetical protein
MYEQKFSDLPTQFINVIWLDLRKKAIISQLNFNSLIFITQIQNNLAQC